ncbi:hypothetical protein ACHAW6_010394 [Cyclotella cf. meneghiniana]
MMDYPRRGQRQRHGLEPPPPTPSTTPRRQSSYSHVQFNSSDQGESGHDSTPLQQFQSSTRNTQQTHVQQSQQQHAQSQQIANLLQFAHSSYTSNPTDALSALMEALTLKNGSNAAQHAMNRIRSELGDTVADCVARHQRIAEGEITQRAMAVVEEMINDTSTFLYAQGRQHILQQAMEDGSSVVCSKCGDMVKADRWSQHSTMWCRAIDDIMEEKDMDC